MLTDREVYAGTKALFQAVEAASKQKGKAEATDVPPDSDLTPAQADKRNNTAKDRYYLFGPDEFPIGPNKEPLRTGDYEPSGTCKDLLSDYDAKPGPAPKFAKDTECLQAARGARLRRPAGRLARDQGARGRGRRRAGAGREPAGDDQALHGAGGRLRAVRRGHQEPRGQHRPEHERAAGDDGVHRQGARGVRARHEAHRRARLRRVDAAAGGHRQGAVLPALRDHARQPDRLAGHDRLRPEPRGHRRPHGRPDREHRRTSTPPTTSPSSCASARCRSSSS